MQPVRLFDYDVSVVGYGLAVRAVARAILPYGIQLFLVVFAQHIESVAGAPTVEHEEEGRVRTRCKGKEKEWRMWV